MIVEELKFSSGKPKPYEVYVTADKGFITQHVSEILNLIAASYAIIGGNKFFSEPADVMRMAVAKIVFNTIGKIAAVALYRNNLGGLKMACIAANKEDPQYREAIHTIIKSDIEPYDNWFWGEVSGPIEHYFKKFNGNSIPNHLSYKFLQKPKKDIVEFSKDGIHYKRFINPDDLSPTEKMIFGFKSKSAYEAVMKSIEDYGRFKIDANSTSRELLEDDISATDGDIEFQAAIVFINELDEQYDNGCREMLPTWRNQLDIAVDTLLKEQNNPDRSQDDLRLVDSNLRLADFLSKHMPMLEFKQFRLK